MARVEVEKPAPSRKRAAKRNEAARTSQWRLRRSGGLRVLESPALVQLGWLVHGFSTRAGGSSDLETLRDDRKRIEEVLNLGFTDWDSREHVLENRRKFVHAIGASKMRFVALRQIHSDIAHRADQSKDSDVAYTPRGDALFTCERGVLLAVRTADCVPILLADTKRRAVAAVHAGWRGTLLRVAEKTLGRMRMEFGTQAEDVIAAFGPAIGRCCYEVGTEVAKEFQAQFEGAREWFDGPFDAVAAGDNDPNWLPWLAKMPPGHQPPPPRVHLDLIAANCAMLAAAGVAPENIHSSGYCTACRTDLFFSNRRERTTGRLMAAIGIC